MFSTTWRCGHAGRRPEEFPGAVAVNGFVQAIHVHLVRVWGGPNMSKECILPPGESI